MSSTVSLRVGVADLPRSRKLNSITRQSAWLFAIALFGYPIVGDLISIFQIDSRVLSIPFRISVGVFSLWIVLIAKRLRVDRWRRLMLLIWFIYCLRLIHDWLFTNLDGADYAFQFFIATSVLPAFALMKAGAFQQQKFALVGFVTASLGSISSMLVTIYGNADVQDVAVSSGRLSLTALDPVSLGHLAASAILCGFVLWRGARMRAKVCLAAMALPLVWCLVLTGSKGPALAIVLCMGLWALRNGQAFKYALMAIPLIALTLAWEGNPLSARLSGSQEDESTVDRLVVLEDSLDQIAGSPIAGSAFVELNSGFYPHNVFVEAAMAMGIPVALLFLALMSFGAWRSWRLLRGENSLLGILYFQALFAASTSGAIFGATMLWVILAMLPGSAVTASGNGRGNSYRDSARSHLP